MEFPLYLEVSLTAAARFGWSVRLLTSCSHCVPVEIKTKFMSKLDVISTACTQNQESVRTWQGVVKQRTSFRKAKIVSAKQVA